MRQLQSLTRGLKALDYLLEQQQPTRLTNIAKALGVQKSNASHVLKTLVACNYARQDDSRRYEATLPKPVSEVNPLEEIIEYKQRCQPVLRSLVAQTGECAHLAVQVKSQVWYIDKIDSTLPLKVDHPIGALSPLHCTALGKAFLAFGAVEDAGELTRYTPNTIIEQAELDEEITKTRERGYAIDDEEFAHGIRCVACPVIDDSGRMIAAMGVSGPSVRVDDRRFKELGDLVRSLEIPRSA